MNEFMMIFRHSGVPDTNLSPEQIQGIMKQWQDWIGGIAARGKFVSTNQLGFQGKTLKPNKMIIDGPYAEVKEIVGGYIIVRAESIDDAMKIAEGCPILLAGGNVEVRDIMQMN